MKQNLDGHVEIQVEDKIALNIFHRKQNTYNILESFFFSNLFLDIIGPECNHHTRVNFKHDWTAVYIVYSQSKELRKEHWFCIENIKIDSKDRAVIG